MANQAFNKALERLKRWWLFAVIAVVVIPAMGSAASAVVATFSHSLLIATIALGVATLLVAFLAVYFERPWLKALAIILVVGFGSFFGYAGIFHKAVIASTTSAFSIKQEGHVTNSPNVIGNNNSVHITSLSYTEIQALAIDLAREMSKNSQAPKTSASELKQEALQLGKDILAYYQSVSPEELDWWLEAWGQQMSSMEQRMWNEQHSDADKQRMFEERVKEGTFLNNYATGFGPRITEVRQKFAALGRTHWDVTEQEAIHPQDVQWLPYIARDFSDRATELK